jgi:hypothetical protein
VQGQRYPGDVLVRDFQASTHVHLHHNTGLPLASGEIMAPRGAFFFRFNFPFRNDV